MRRLIQSCAVVAAVLAMGVAFVACGSSSNSSSSSGSGSSGEATTASAESGDVSIDLGTTTLEVPKGTPKIGFFAWGISSYELSYKEQIEKMNQEGSDVTWVEAKYDPATQLKQLQTALTTGEYDAWIVEAVDAEGACKIVSEQAPDQGIPVSLVLQPVCGRAQKPWGEEVWTPGTLNLVAATGNVTGFKYVLESEAKVLGIKPGTEVGVVNGPDIASQAQAYGTAIKDAGIEPVEIVKGDYTAPTAQKLVNGMLSRHPGIEVILTGYEGATPGIIAALKEAGKSPGEVKVGDIGGSKEISVRNIKSGWLTVSAVHDPRIIAKTAIEQVDEAFEGNQGPRTLIAYPPGSSLEDPLLMTKENVGTLQPTF